MYLEHGIIKIVLFLIECLVVFVLGKATYILWKNIDATEKFTYKTLINILLCILFFFLTLVTVIRFFLW